ncbi:MAG: ABC transporter ATP-binding protein/permease [Cephaloticoccus sp.]|nr:ABC transporter ATP-binding protein/permease [Cephaloticoccus sp.]MCF7758999.1 ABC transporter ATP-binding protein/permease [Cephaloticoccus sp.]
MTAQFHQEDDFKAKLDAGLWWKIFRRALNFKRYLVPLFFASLLLAVGDSSFAFITRWVIDGVVRDGLSANFTLYAGVYLGVTLVFSSCIWGFIFLAGNISYRLSHDIRRDSFDRLQELEFSFFDTRPVGWLITRLTSDCDRLSRTIAWGFLDIVWGLSLVGMIAISLLILNWRLGLIVLSVMPPLAIISRVFQKRMLFSSREIRKHNSQITASYNESIQGVRTTKTLVREADNLGEFEHVSQNMYAASVLNARQNALFYPLVMTIGSLAAGLALWHGGWLASQHSISLGTLIAFVTFAGMFFNPINSLAQRLTEIQAAQAAGERVMGLLETVPAIKDSPEVLARIAAHQNPHSDLPLVRQNLEEGGSPGSDLAAGPEPVEWAPDGLPARIETIEFRDVSFHYSDGTAVLANFNLKVAPGETIALVGPSGGGKSTIVSLVCRFYEPVSGQILINGTDYRERGLAWLQSQLGIVLQTPHLFKGTIRENIRYGRLEATDAEVEAAAKMVNAHEFISDIPGGYDSSVGEGGNQLSTGQRQLISFARALLANPQIFVMDEATSSIDTETEQLIQRGLETVLTGRISFVIAHRLSTIRRANRILVITKGQIEECGTHEELLKQRGHYYGLYTNQFRREREEAVLSGEPV